MITAHLIKKLGVIDMIAKLGALGVALAGLWLLSYGIDKLYADNQKLNENLVIIVREYALSQAGMIKAIENNTRVIENLLYQRKTTETQNEEDPESVAYHLPLSECSGDEQGCYDRATQNWRN